MDKSVFYNISYGMFVIGSDNGKKLNAQIANTVFQITSDPATIAVSINKQNLTHEYIKESKRFSVSILDEDTPIFFIGKFGFKSGRSEDKFKDTQYKILESGCPVITDFSVAYLEAKVVKEFDCLTHTLFLSEVVDSSLLKDGLPMTYAYYQKVKRGITPKTAPTFINAEAPKIGNPEFPKYRCTVCNYVYDPVVGDTDGNIPAGTAFEKIPDTWRCPVCGADKSKFVRIV
jgi:flavin reductase (DIM6/NTAB) family NADH-FMN oxidoreductase RutF/rubredoxin